MATREKLKAEQRKQARAEKGLATLRGLSMSPRKTRLVIDPSEAVTLKVP